MTNDVYNRFDPSKQYDSHEFRASKGLQSAELNEIQSAMHHRLQGLGDVLFNDGDVVAGVDPQLSVDQLTLQASALYVRGSVRLVESATLTVPTTGEVAVGVYLKSETITALDDPNLRDPATGTRNYQEEGANRTKITLVWGYAGDGQEGDFFPVYGIRDGNLLQNSPPPQTDATLQLVSRYDMNANGHYVIEGMETSYIGMQYPTSVNKGVVSVDGAGDVDGLTLTHNAASAANLRIPFVTEVGKKYTVAIRVDTSNNGTYDYTAYDNTGSSVITTKTDLVDGVYASMVFTATSTDTHILVQYTDVPANGDSFVVMGINLRDEADVGNQVFSVSEGEAHVNGFEVRNVNSYRLAVGKEPDTDTILNEPHTFTDSGNGTAVITMNKSPIAEVSNVQITKRTPTTLTHGAFTGASDPLPDESVLSIVEVKQGGTTYTLGTDYLFTGDEIDWSPAGAEPAPSSTYEVTYDHIVNIEPVAVGTDTVTIDTALDGTVAYFDYTWNLPRIDRIAVSQEGVVSLIKGQASKYNPQPAAIPNGLLGIASVIQDWLTDPEIVVDGVKVTPMNELESMKNDISSLYDLVAQERLRNDANIADPSAKKGVFVDPFFDDDLRDQGVAQTAAIVDGELMLAIDADIEDISSTMGDTETLAYTYEAILVQDKSTSEMKINPYQAFDPIPAKLKLNRAVDRFTQVVTTWGSPVTRRLWVWGNSFSGTTKSTQSTTRSVRDIEHLRQININVVASGFGAGEEVESITFDGIDVTPNS